VKGRLSVDSKQIHEITTQGIIYTDNEGNKQFIDFTDCFNTFLKRTLSAPTTTKLIAEVARRSKQVGEINYLGDKIEVFPPDSENPPYVMFYGNELIRFEFSGQNECSKFHQRILESGWYVDDLTD
jgi:hypothetical protein